MNYLDDMTNSELAQVTRALQIEPEVANANAADETFLTEEEQEGNDAVAEVMNENEDATTQISAAIAP